MTLPLIFPENTEGQGITVKNDPSPRSTKEIPIGLDLLHRDFLDDERELIGWMRALLPVHKDG